MFLGVMVAIPCFAGTSFTYPVSILQQPTPRNRASQPARHVFTICLTAVAPREAHRPCVCVCVCSSCVLPASDLSVDQNASLCPCVLSHLQEQGAADPDAGFDPQDQAEAYA